jgi:hypothetical protein
LLVKSVFISPELIINKKSINMKKLLLLGLAMSIGFLTYAQQVKVKSNVKSSKMITSQMSVDPIMKSPTLTQSTYVHPVADGTKSTNDLTILTLGTSNNGLSYGYGGGNRTILWADDNLNTVINMHRMGPPASPPPSYTGYLGIDRSTDLGASFTNNIEVYSATKIAVGQTYYSDAARYPQGAIYNPFGNTDPANAYATYFAPCLDRTNDATGWGGYALGVANLMDNADSSKLNISSRPADGVYQYIPDGLTVCQNSGDMWGVDLNSNWSSGSFVYGGGLIVTHGVFDAAAKKYDYTQSQIEVSGYNPCNNKIAFAPDGLTGWIVALGDLDPSIDSSFYPILFKTTDGGLTWSDPIEVILSGPDGVSAVLNYLTDAQIATIYADPVPARDEIPYTTAFDCDIVVDANGNPHIAVIVGPTGSSGYSISTPAYIPGVFDITTFDGGTSWVGQWIKNVKTFRHTFVGASPAPTEDNRIQASTTMDGSKLFISWIETVYPDPTVTDNDLPDIFTVGIDPIHNFYTDTVNVTEFSDAWLAAFCANASHYVFTDDGKYTIPFSYEVLTGGSLDNAVTYKYISNFSFVEADFTNVGIGDNKKPVSNFTISPAYPNPTSGLSVVKVNLDKASNLSLTVYNLTGQKVSETSRGNVATGAHDLTIDCSGLNAGVYFYTVKAGDSSITRKLVVK